MDNFVPKESDKQWLRDLLLLLKVGGIWGTSWAIYKKEGEKTIAVVKGNTDTQPDDNVEDNINRVKLVAESIGLKFIDRREDGLYENLR